MKQKTKYAIQSFLAMVVLVFIDQITKYFAMKQLNPEYGGKDFIIWKGVFRLHYLENRGAAFGLMQNQKLFFIVMTVVVCVLLCVLFFKLPCDKHFHILHWLITILMAGALGNFIDRMRLSYVVDFFDFELINFPVFNVADIYVVCSVIIFMILFMFYYSEEDLERILPSCKKRRTNGSNSGI